MYTPIYVYIYIYIYAHSRNRQQLVACDGPLGRGKSSAALRGNRLSSTTCLTHVLFKSDK